jgi:hypothetical protein
VVYLVVRRCQAMEGPRRRAASNRQLSKVAHGSRSRVRGRPAPAKRPVADHVTAGSALTTFPVGKPRPAAVLHRSAHWADVDSG